MQPLGTSSPQNIYIRLGTGLPVGQGTPRYLGSALLPSLDVVVHEGERQEIDVHGGLEHDVLHHQQLHEIGTNLLQEKEGRERERVRIITGSQPELWYRSCELECDVMWEYSGTPLLWTPWGPSKVSCIERCAHFRGKFLLRKHIWDIAKCP